MHADAQALDELICIHCDSIRLDAQLTYPATGAPRFAALVVGAHPLLGGHAGNNVVNALRSGLGAKNAIAMSFNYRGVGGGEPTDLDWPRMISDFWKSSSVPEERLWIQDARCALHHIRSLAQAPAVLIGYSFGCHVVSELLKSDSAAASICISPNPIQHDLGGLESHPMPRLVISSDNDFSCPPEAMAAWFLKLSGNSRHVLIPNAEHFFRGREPEVVDACMAFMNDVGVREAML
ncbi:MAG: hypothetical protein H6819_06255 [Phycisphaerales bacterium]|nr:hypothetical protein [Phycisphaerales bacterium]MCB9858577.1 hypothetical protein [Phycisphaerales bacterium]